MCIRDRGGYKTQARSAEMALKLLEVVDAFEKAGCIAIVVEAVPSEVAKIVYERSTVPILGSGCGPYSDSPMINWYDLLGFFTRNAKFAKKYANIREEIDVYKRQCLYYGDEAGMTGYRDPFNRGCYPCLLYTSRCV